MGRTQDIGQAGEAKARAWLEEKGYRFLEQNWWCKLGEIDLVMQDGKTRVLVEVRLRTAKGYGSGIDSVTISKQRKLLKAAQAYQKALDYWGDIRIDVIGIEKKDDDWKIEHIENAIME
jgi:putative endonuclease